MLAEARDRARSASISASTAFPSTEMPLSAEISAVISMGNPKVSYSRTTDVLGTVFSPADLASEITSSSIRDP